MLVRQATNARMRRPEYEAMSTMYLPGTLTLIYNAGNRLEGKVNAETTENYHSYEMHCYGR